MVNLFPTLSCTHDRTHSNIHGKFTFVSMSSLLPLTRNTYDSDMHDVFFCAYLMRILVFSCTPDVNASIEPMAFVSSTYSISTTTCVVSTYRGHDTGLPVTSASFAGSSTFDWDETFQLVSRRSITSGKPRVRVGSHGPKVSDSPIGCFIQF